MKKTLIAKKYTPEEIKLMEFVRVVKEGKQPNEELLQFVANGLSKIDIRAINAQVGKQFKDAFSLPKRSGRPTSIGLKDIEKEICKLHNDGWGSRRIFDYLRPPGRANDGIADSAHVRKIIRQCNELYLLLDGIENLPERIRQDNKRLATLCQSVINNLLKKRTCKTRELKELQATLHDNLYPNEGLDEIIIRLLQIIESDYGPEFKTRIEDTPLDMVEELLKKGLDCS